MASATDRVGLGVVGGCMGELSDVDEAGVERLAGERAVGGAQLSGGSPTDVGPSRVELTDLRLPADRDTGFEELFRREYAPMVRLAYLLVGREDIAVDAVHDALTKVYERWSKIDNHGGYLRTSVVNRCRDVKRRWRRDRERAETRTADVPPAELEPLELVDALGKLSPKQRQALVLRYYADLSEAETAELMDVPRGTVKSHVSRGLAELRKVVER